MNTIRFNNGNTEVIAHRGLSGIELENTCSAFVAAGNRSYFGIETDVHKTSDGKFVIFHDDRTGRVAGDDMIVENTTMRTLQAMVLIDKDGKRGREDLRMPELVDYVRICKKYEKKAVLELKNAFRPEEILEIAKIIEAEDYLENMIFISFDLRNLVTLRASYPDTVCQFLVDDYTDDLVKILVENNLDLDMCEKFVTKEIIDTLHENGRKINCWTCDNPEWAEQLADWDIDFITSNILEGC